MLNAALRAHVLTPPWLAGRRPLAASRAPVTFPETPLRLLTRIALGADLTADPSTWSWLEISDRVRWDHGNGIRTVVGRRDESTTVTQSQAFLMVDNRDGALSRRNPASPYYGLLSMNTPIWIEADPGDGGHTRFAGFVNSWPKRWQDESLNDSYVMLECSGILRRLQQNTDVKSALKRTILAAGPAGYWPMEEGQNTDIAGSALSGVRGMSIEGTVDFTAADGPPGSGPLCNGLFADQGTFRAPAVIGSGGDFQISFIFRAGVTAGAAGVAVTWVDPNDATEQFWTITVDSIEGTQVSVAASDGTAPGLGSTIAASEPGTVTFGQYYHCVYRQKADGTRTVHLDDVSYAAVVSGTSGPPRDVQATPARPDLIAPQGDISFGHFAMWADSTTDVPSHYDAMLGYDGELAHVRLRRACAEEAVRYTSLAVASEPMGPQPVDSLMNVLRECETADMGVLYESDWGLAYQSRTERYNQSVGLALDLSQAEIAREPEVDDDDQHVINRWVVTRTTGSKATAEDATGPLGSGPNGVGLWERPVTVNVAEDAQLPDQASWRLHQSTVDEDRWPHVDIALHHDPDLIDDWTGLTYGARAQIASPPDQVAPDTVDVIVEGHSEQINQVLWSASLNTSPASPYTVAVYGSADPNGSGPDHYDTLGSATTAAFVAGTDTSMSVATASGPIWTTDADDFPFNIRVSGVVLEVTNITGASSPQTFTITQTPVSGGPKTIPSGEAVALARTPIYAL